MTTKTIYACDRCGEEFGDQGGWYFVVPYVRKTDEENIDLCPSCSERALEKPPCYEPARCGGCGGTCHEVGNLFRRDNHSAYFCAGCRQR